MIPFIASYIVYSSTKESSRAEQVQLLQNYLPDAKIIEAIYPSTQKIPFIEKILQQSKEQGGRKLLMSEVGVFMSHRKIWQAIAKSKTGQQHYLILESDSCIQDIEMLQQQYNTVEENYDLFFWGAWNNHVSIKRSSRKKIDKNEHIGENQYYMGEPLIKSVYGTYGYSLNSATASYLLSVTKKIVYPIDFYKQYLDTNCIKVGAIHPEIIGTWQSTDSTIRNENRVDKIKKLLIIKIFNTRNQILAYFC